MTDIDCYDTKPVPAVVAKADVHRNPTNTHQVVT